MAPAGRRGPSVIGAGPGGVVLGRRREIQRQGGCERLAETAQALTGRFTESAWAKKRRSGAPADSGRRRTTR